MIAASELNHALERLMTSADPAVRGIAIRYKQKVQELVGLQGFISLYAEAQAEMTQTVKVPTPLGAEFVHELHAILMGNDGEPVPLKVLHETYYDRNPNMVALTIEVFRARLFKLRQKHELGYIDDVGYVMPSKELVSDEKSVAA